MPENTPFFTPSPTTTAADLHKTVEDLRTRREALDRKLMAMLPNLAASHMIALGQNQADLENCSAHCVLGLSDFALMLPDPAMAELYSSPPSGDKDVKAACSRIMPEVGKVVVGILSHLDFKCKAVYEEINHQLTIDMSW
jgi:hypothetical protein